MAVQQFQYVRFTTQYLLNFCRVQAREPFVPSPHPLALPPTNEIEVQTPSGTNLSDTEVGKLVEQWVDVFHMHWHYMNVRMTYIHLRQPNAVLTLGSIDTSLPIGATLKKVWVQFLAMKDAWQTHENEGFSIRRTQ